MQHIGLARLPGMRSLGVTARILLMAGCGLIGMLVVGGAALVSRNIYNAGEQEIAALTTLRTSALRLRADVERARGELYEFIQVRSADRASALERTLTAMQTSITALETADSAQALTKPIAVIREQAQIAAREFGELSRQQEEMGADRSTGLEGELDQRSRALERTLRSLLNQEQTLPLQRAATAIYSVLRIQERMLMTPDVETEGMLDMTVGRAERALAAFDGDASARDTLVSELKAFVASLATWTQAARTRGERILRSESAMVLMREPLQAIGAEVEQRSIETAARVEAGQAFLERITLLGVLITLLVCAICAYVVIRSISGPLRALTGATRAIAAGDLSVRLAGIDARDELGEMARAVAVLRDGMVERERLAGQAVADAELRSRRAGEIDHSVTGFDASVGGVLSLLGDAGEALQFASRELQDASHKVAAETARANEASSTMKERVASVAGATEELSASIAEIASSTGRAAEVADGAIREVGGTTLRMQELNAISNEIGEVVSLIQSIASQTNLLALNATIEAARAGAAGRGFAVVASEVKELAGQTQRATEEIARRISAIQSSAAGMSEAIRSVAQVVSDMREIAGNVAAAVRQQDATVQEIAATMSMVADDAGTSANAVAHASHAATRADEVARRVQETAGSLTGAADRLTGDVRTFIDTVKAA
jgi:methyl-accepting chemotaxis protein